MNRRQRKKQLRPFIREVFRLRPEPGDIILLDLHREVPARQLAAFRRCLALFREEQIAKGICCPVFIVTAGATADVMVVSPKEAGSEASQ